MNERIASISAVVSCMDGYDPDALPVDTARAAIRACLAPVGGVERVATRSALGRVLAEELVPAFDVPAHDNSAMDGWALRSADLEAAGATTLNEIGSALAGRTYSGAVGPGECVRVMTGAVMPQGTDAVVIQELVKVDGRRITVPAGQKRGQNVRAAGEDLKTGVAVLHPGRALSPADLGLIASLGIGEVAVRTRLRVAFFSTGDELVPIGSSPGRGQIYDSNRYTLFAMLTRLGVEIIDLGVVGDDATALEAAFKQAADVADAIITTGGVSVGDADLVMESFEELGRVEFWSVAMKPGRPTVFGKVGNALYFGLPGNPVSVMATFYQLARPGILKLSGATPAATLTVRARCGQPIKRRNDRLELVRGVLSEDDDGRHVVDKTGAQGSGILSSMARANCFIVVPSGEGVIDAGEEVDVQPFDAFV
jgi:molybdopterin molybdotransferase